MRREDLKNLCKATREAQFLAENIAACEGFLHYLTLVDGKLQIQKPNIQLWAQDWATPLGIVRREIGPGYLNSDVPEVCFLTSEEISEFRDLVSRRMNRLELALAALKVRF